MITVNIKRAADVFEPLLCAYLNKEYPYNRADAVLPQEHNYLPKSLQSNIGSREHAMYLFILCYWMRGGIKSLDAAIGLAKLYEKRPEIFLPETEPMIDEDDLFELFGQVGLGHNASEISQKTWRENHRRLLVNWGGDPRNIFNGITTYEESCLRIQNKKDKGFFGFQEKMVSMITYFFMDAGIVDRWNFPIPVDIHVQRKIFAHEIVTADKSETNNNGLYTKPILAAIRKLSYDYCAEHGVDPIDLCSAVWLYSGIMCSKHPGNRSNIVGPRRGRKTTIVPVKKWTHAQAKMFDQTCGRCPVRGTCKWCIPSKPYYINGVTKIVGERDTPPQLSLFWS